MISLPRTNPVFVRDLLCGREVDRDSEVDAALQREELKASSERIVAMLEDAGTPMIVPRSMTAIGPVTGCFEELTTYRNSNMVPVNQASNHHAMLRELTCYCENIPDGQLRMLVVKGGWVDIPDYREAHQKHCRRMSRFAADPFLKSLGISCEYYNVENTINWGRPETPNWEDFLTRHDGCRAYLNLHSHLIIRCERYLGPEVWRSFLDYARGFFPGGYVHDSKLMKAAEAVKYCFKGADLISLGPLRLKRLFEETYKLKFYHPLGGFKAFRSHLRENSLKVKRLPIGDEWRWHYVEKYRKPPKEKRERVIVDGEAHLLLGEYRDTPPRIRPHGYIRAILDPAPRFSATMEPTLLVEAFDGDLEGLLKDHGLTYWAERVRANRPPSIKDTTAITVRENPSEFSIMPDDPPGPPPDWFTEITKSMAQAASQTLN
ncbi:MAG: hypothetical protein AAF221_08340 [Pseudomonadota bacterium]